MLFFHEKVEKRTQMVDKSNNSLKQFYFNLFRLKIILLLWLLRRYHEKKVYLFYLYFNTSFCLFTCTEIFRWRVQHTVCHNGWWPDASLYRWYLQRQDRLSLDLDRWGTLPLRRIQVRALQHELVSCSHKREFCAQGLRRWFQSALDCLGRWPWCAGLVAASEGGTLSRHWFTQIVISW